MINNKKRALVIGYIILYVILIIPITYGFVPLECGVQEWLDALQSQKIGFIIQFLGRGGVYVFVQLVLQFFTLINIVIFLTYMLEDMKTVYCFSVVYVTFPIRFYFCYKPFSFFVCIIWMMIPMIWYAIMKARKKKNVWKKLKANKYITGASVLSVFWWIYLCNTLF